jgi:hypothetical protein
VGASRIPASRVILAQVASPMRVAVRSRWRRQSIRDAAVPPALVDAPLALRKAVYRTLCRGLADLTIVK